MMASGFLSGSQPTQRLANVLLEYVRPRRWYRAKSRVPRGARLADLIALDVERIEAATNVMAVLEIAYETGDPDLYVIPLAWVDRSAAQAIKNDTPHAVIDDLSDGGGILVDGLVTGQAAPSLLALMREGRTLRGQGGSLRGEVSPAFAEVAEGRAASPSGSGAAAALDAAFKVARGEQTNSTVTFADRIQMKVYRQLASGPNPELEVGRVLTSHCQPPCAPRVLASLAYHGPDGAVRSVGIAHEFLHNEGDAWALVSRELKAQLEADAASDRAAVPGGRFPALVETLGRRTGELHLALASDASDADFAPEPLTDADRAAWADRAAAMLNETLSALAAALGRLTPPDRALAERLLAESGREKLSLLLTRFRERSLPVAKTRTHGDLHLGQVLVRGDDFVIIDFEGEPARPLAERRAKNSPLRDVMGMVRSFAYAPEAALREGSASGLRPEGGRDTRRWAADWTAAVTAAYLRGYHRAVGRAPFLPGNPGNLSLMSDFYLLEKVIYEVGYEVNNRPDWVAIPLRGLAAIAGVAEENT